MKIPSRHRILICYAVVLLGILFLVCSHYHIWSYRDYQIYQAISRYPFALEMWFGRLKAGDDLAPILAANQHYSLQRIQNRFVVVRILAGGHRKVCLPFESMTLIAKDGKLRAAAITSCTWKHDFFADHDSLRDMPTESNESWEDNFIVE